MGSGDVFWVATIACCLAVACIGALVEYRAGSNERDHVCRELLHHADARYVGMPAVCEVPHGQ